MQLDGIYRLHSGQQIYTDFSSPFGVALYALPLMFVHSAGDLALSVSYASGLYLGVGLLLVLYLTWTRLSPVLGLALGIWIALALAARMTAGDGWMAVTLAENYNRNCAAALALALLICRAPRISSPIIAISDGLLYALLTAFMLYTKVPYGLAALVFVPVVIYPLPRRLATFAAFAVAFGLIVLAVEYGYGTRFQWLQAVRTSVAVYGVSKPGPIAEVVFGNLAELLVCILVPAWFLWQERRFTPWAMIFFVMVAGAAVETARLGATHFFLFLPAVLFFVAAPPALPWSEQRPAAAVAPRRERLRYAFTAITLTVLIAESAAPFINILFSAYQSLTQPPMVAGDDVLGRIVFRSQKDDDMIKPIVDGQTTALDAFSIARTSRPMQRWDPLTMPEFRDYLTDGVRAAREGCKRGDRILTADVSNPFPLLLGWPVGGGMVIIQPGLTLSDKAHPSTEELFQNIDCVLVPKLPLQRAARDFVLDIYGAYLSQRFKTVQETPLWKVLR